MKDKPLCLVTLEPVEKSVGEGSPLWQWTARLVFEGYAFESNEYHVQHLSPTFAGKEGFENWWTAQDSASYDVGGKFQIKWKLMHPSGREESNQLEMPFEELDGHPVRSFPHTIVANVPPQ